MFRFHFNRTCETAEGHTDLNCEVGDVLLFSCAWPTPTRSNPKHHRLLHTRPPGDAWKCCEKNGIGAAVFALRQSLAAHGHEWAVRKKRIIDERDADERQRDREERIIEVTRGAATESWHAAASYPTRAATRRRLRTCSLLFPASPFFPACRRNASSKSRIHLGRPFNL